MQPVDRYFHRLPPTDSGVDPLHQVQSQVTSAVAATFDWTTALKSALSRNELEGTYLLLVQAQTTDAVVRFKATGAAATTLTNGIRVIAGQPPMVFYVDPRKHNICDFISTGAGTVQFQVCSKPYMRIAL